MESISMKTQIIPAVTNKSTSNSSSSYEAEAPGTARQCNKTERECSTKRTWFLVISSIERMITCPIIVRIETSPIRSIHVHDCIESEAKTIRIKEPSLACIQKKNTYSLLQLSLGFYSIDLESIHLTFIQESNTANKQYGNAINKEKENRMDTIHAMQWIRFDVAHYHGSKRAQCNFVAQPLAIQHNANASLNSY